MAEGFSLKIPLRYNKEDGPYQLTKTLPETVKQNFINLIMTIPGERVMNPDFGVGVHQLLFENEKSEVVEIFKERLFDQAKKYLPFIKITNTEINLVEHTMNIIITYYISNLGISSALSLNIDKK
jgi:phage baseplate assembly protein W